MSDRDFQNHVDARLEVQRLKNELVVAVEHANDLIRQRNELRSLNKRLMDAVARNNANVYGIQAWALEEHGAIECSKIEAVLAAVRWKAGL